MVGPAPGARGHTAARRRGTDRRLLGDRGGPVRRSRTANRLDDLPLRVARKEEAPDAALDQLALERKQRDAYSSVPRRPHRNGWSSAGQVGRGLRANGKAGAPPIRAIDLLVARSGHRVLAGSSQTIGQSGSPRWARTDSCSRARATASRPSNEPARICSPPRPSWERRQRPPRLLLTQGRADAPPPFGACGTGGTSFKVPTPALMRGGLFDVGGGHVLLLQV